MQNKKYGTQEFERLKKEFEDSQKKLKEARKKLERVIIEDELESLREEGFSEPLNILEFSERDIEAMARDWDKEENTTDFPSTDPNSRFMELCDAILNREKNDNPNKLKIHELVEALCEGDCNCCEGETENKIPESFIDEVNKLNKEKCEMDKREVGNEKHNKIVMENSVDIGRLGNMKENKEGGFEEVGRNRNMGQEANAGLCRDDSKVATRLLEKNFSPMLVRKYQYLGWPLFLGIICDANLNDLDKVVYEIGDRAKELGFLNGNIQDSRNFCGYLNNELVNYYNNIKQGVAEGFIVLWSIDKCVISSAYGDFMTHNKTCGEFYSIVNTLPHI